MKNLKYANNTRVCVCVCVCSQLSEYYEATFTGSRALVAGSGIEYNLLTEFGNFLELPSGNVLQPETAKFYGGEERLGLRTPITHVAVAAEASG